MFKPKLGEYAYVLYNAKEDGYMAIEVFNDDELKLKIRWINGEDSHTIDLDAIDSFNNQLVVEMWTSKHIENLATEIADYESVGLNLNDPLILVRTTREYYKDGCANHRNFYHYEFATPLKELLCK